MDSISVLLTSCIVLILLAVTTIKYAYVKLTKQSYAKGDIEVSAEDGQLYQDIPKRRKRSKKGSSINKRLYPISNSFDSSFLASFNPSDDSALNVVPTGQIDESIPSGFDQVDCDRNECIYDKLKGSNEHNDNQRGGPDKFVQNGSVTKTKTTRIVYMNTQPTAADCLAENFIKEIEMNVVPNADKSTLIIHAVQKAAPVEDNKIDEFEFEEPVLPSVPENGQYEFLYNKPSRKSGRGNLFRSLRHRLSKKHSYSVKNPKVWETEPYDDDIITEKEDIILRCSVPENAHDLHDVQLHSTTSSASELSTFSRQSTATYTHENSTLVVECMENQVKKFYLVPPHLIKSGKWRKRGKKLHIYNDHSFVAKHISSGKFCEICKSRIPFALGKQGYQCRDCKMICHKECHVRSPSPCPKTSVYEFEFFANLV